MYNKLVCFDFDGTLFNTPTPHEGREIWKKKTGLDWPYGGGWWGKAESLNTDIFYINLNEWVYRKYLEAKADPSTYVILATGRLLKAPKMLENVNIILDQYDLKFDGVYLNWGGETFNFKTRLFEQLLAKLKIKDLTMYDDRHEHLIKFKTWADEQKTTDIKIVDIVNKKIYTN